MRTCEEPRWRGLLAADVPPAARAYRARWVLALDEAVQSFGRVVPWDEWNRIWFGRREVITFDAAKRALVRLKRELRQFRVRLRGIPGGEIHAGACDVSALVEPWVRRAREIDERIAARKDGRPPELGNLRQEAARVRADDVVATAGGETESSIKGKQSASHSYLWLCQRFGISNRRLRYLLSCRGAARAPTRRRRLEDEHEPLIVEQALRAFDRGGTVRDVADVLGCSSRTASLLLKRHGRRVARRGPRSSTPVPVLPH